MNKITSALWLTALLLMFGCTKDNSNNAVYDTSKTIAPVLQITPLSAILNENTPADTALILSWKAAEYSFDAAVEYVAEFAVKGSNFSKKRSRILQAGKLNAVFTHKELNELLNEDEFVPLNVLSNLEVRLISQPRTASPVSKPQVQSYSNIIEITVKSYAASEKFLYVPGGHQGWAPQDAGTLTAITGQIYTGFVYFEKGGAEFKITTKPGWDGIALGASELSISGSVTEGGGGNLKMTGLDSEELVYFITVDLVAKTLKAEPKTNWIGDPRKHSWAVIGDAIGGWDPTNDKNLSFNKSNSLWQGNIAFSANGKFKYRANKAWDNNYGTTVASDGTDTNKEGSLKLGGENFLLDNVKSYKITLDMRNPDSPKYKME